MRGFLQMLLKMTPMQLGRLQQRLLATLGVPAFCSDYQDSLLCQPRIRSLYIYIWLLCGYL